MFRIKVYPTLLPLKLQFFVELKVVPVIGIDQDFENKLFSRDGKKAK